MPQIIKVVQPSIKTLIVDTANPAPSILDAQYVTYTPTTLTATDVQAAIDELAVLVETLKVDTQNSIAEIQLSLSDLEQAIADVDAGHSVHTTSAVEPTNPKVGDTWTDLTDNTYNVFISGGFAQILKW